MYNYKSLQVAQLLQEHLSSLQNFIIKKYLKQQFDNDQALWPLYNWRYKDLSISRDKKVMTLSPMEKCPIDFYHGVAFTAKI